MTQELTFIHAADLHLGAPFRGLRALSPKWADRLLDAIPEAYGRVVDAALQHQVDFVIIAGDIFDTQRASYADYRCFFEGLYRLNEANIPVYLCTGNHDPFTSWQRDFFAFPPNTHMLSGEHPEFLLYKRNNQPLCVLGGRGFYNQAWPQDQNIAEGITKAAAKAALGPEALQAPFSVGILHTGLDQDPYKAPVKPSELLRAGFDYWALGHIHLRYLDNELNPRISYSGCIQGRDIKETGQRGINLVKLREGYPNEVTFIPTASVVWQQTNLDVEECSTLAEINNKIVRELFRENGLAQCEEMCVRLTLVGQTSLHETLAREDVLEGIREFINSSYSEFFCDAVLNKTVQPRNREALTREGLFPAVFLQASESLKQNSEEMQAYVQDEFLKKNLQQQVGNIADLDNLAQEAENFVLDLLGGGEKQ